MRWRLGEGFFLLAILTLLSTDRTRPITAEAIRALIPEKRKVYARFLFSEKNIVYQVAVGLGPGWSEGTLRLLTGSTKDYMHDGESYKRLEHYACHINDKFKISESENLGILFTTLVESGVDKVIPKGRDALFIGTGAWPQALEGLVWSLLLEIYGNKGGKTIITIPFEEKLSQLPPERRELKPWQKKLQPLFPIVKEKLLPLVHQPKYRIYPKPTETPRANLLCEEQTTQPTAASTAQERNKAQ